MTREDEGHIGGWVLVAVLLAVAGAAASYWRPLAPDLELAATDLAWFDDRVLDAVEAYRRPRLVIALAATVLPVITTILVATTPWGRALVVRVAGERWPVLRAAAVGGVVAVLASLSVLPLAAWVGIVHDGRWGFRTASPAAWLGDWTIRSAGRWLLVAGAAMVLVLAIRRWPRSWPYRLTVVGTMLAALGVFAHPVVLLPLTLPTQPLADPAHAAAMAPVLDAAGDPDLPVFVGIESERSTRVNAIATGLGPTARIVVYDNLLELPPEQVASVVAHEIAHHEHRDVPRGVALVATVLLPAGLVLRWLLGRDDVRRTSGARWPGDPRTLAVVLAVVAVMEVAVQPVGHLVSRRLEAAADARSLELTQDPSTLVAATRVFTIRDLATPEPPQWVTLLYRSHPSVGDRIRQASAIAERDGAPLPRIAELATRERDQRHPAIVEGPP